MTLLAIQLVPGGITGLHKSIQPESQQKIFFKEWLRVNTLIRVILYYAIKY